jgi:hypothetical protein
VIAINEIDIGISRWSKKNRVAGSLAYRCMRGGIVGAEVSFDFHDPSREQVAALPTNQKFAQHLGPDLTRIAVVEGPGEGIEAGIRATLIRNPGHVEFCRRCPPRLGDLLRVGFRMDDG